MPVLYSIRALYNAGEGGKKRRGKLFSFENQLEDEDSDEEMDEDGDQSDDEDGAEEPQETKKSTETHADFERRTKARKCKVLSRQAEEEESAHRQGSRWNPRAASSLAQALG